MPTDRPTSSRPGKILIVDDEPDARVLVQKILQFRGYEVIEAADGQAALDLVAKENPDLVLLDVNMPEMDGYEVILRLRQWEQDQGRAYRVPVVFLSARQSGEDRARGLQLGASDFISKPFHKDELYIRLERSLDKGGFAGKGGHAAPTHTTESSADAAPAMRFDATILVVEDAVAIRRVLATMLTSMGCRALTAEDGPQALRILDTNRVDMVLLDVMMPKMDGLEVLKRIKGSELTAHIPVVMCTAKGQSKDVLDAIKLGAADYVVKPFRKETIQGKLVKLLNRPGEPEDDSFSPPTGEPESQA